MGQSSSHLPISKLRPELRVYRKDHDVTIFPWDTPPGAVQAWTQRVATWERFRIVFLVHGFLEDSSAPWLHDMKNALLEIDNDPKLVVMVDWGFGAKGHLWYDDRSVGPWSPLNCIPTIGRWLADYLKTLRWTFPKAYFHGIGHSLGGHILGSASRLGSRGLDRISALDPAGPAFEKGVMLRHRLKATDARVMVDVIHTDGRHRDHAPALNPIKSFGTLTQLGTVDFYPNYGLSPQPGCALSVDGSHRRALELFLWSIRHQGAFVTDKMLASYSDQQYSTWDRAAQSGKRQHQPGQHTDEIVASGVVAQMGYFADQVQPRPQGRYYIKTSDSEPWVDNTPLEVKPEQIFTDFKLPLPSPSPPSYHSAPTTLDHNGNIGRKEDAEKSRHNGAVAWIVDAPLNLNVGQYSYRD